MESDGVCVVFGSIDRLLNERGRNHDAARPPRRNLANVFSFFCPVSLTVALPVHLGRPMQVQDAQNSLPRQERPQDLRPSAGKLQ